MSSFANGSRQDTDDRTANTETPAANDEPYTFEHIALSVSECFVYKVPTLRSASGHRAEDWSLAAPLFTGALRMYQSDMKMRIALFTYNDPKTLSMAAENLTLFGGAQEINSLFFEDKMSYRSYNLMYPFVFFKCRMFH